MKIVIIGAGIGGLTTAIALKNAGYDYEIYEAAPQISEVGAGITLSHNAMKVFRNFGLAEKLLKLGNKFNFLNITKANLDILSSVDTSQLSSEDEIENIAIHRADLHQLLMEEAGMEHIHTDKRLKAVSEENGIYILSFEDGSKVEAEYVIGADGLRSRLRNIFFGDSVLRDAHQLCWRGVTDFDLPRDLHNKCYESWGKGKRFGYVKVNARQVYWYLVINDNMVTENSDILSFTNDLFPLAQQLIKATPKEKRIINKLFDLKPISIWSKAKVCLMGDAAHATTPNLGQGACQAIEDAYVLGELLKKHSVDQAFKIYPQLRMKKAHDIVNTSWQIGKMAHLSNPIAVFMRDAMMKMTPKKMLQKRFQDLYALAEV